MKKEEKGQREGGDKFHFAAEAGRRGLEKSSWPGRGVSQGHDIRRRRLVNALTSARRDSTLGTGGGSAQIR